jgi:DNA-binding transcriptional LysR family regulator
VFAWEFASGDGAIERVEIAPALIVNDPEALALAAVDGAGLAQIGSNVALPHIHAGRLRLLLPDRTVRSRGIYAVYPSKRYAPAKLTAFIEHLAGRLAERADLVP